MNSKDGLLLWVLGAAGIFFIYAAYKNISPGSVLTGYFTGIPATSSGSNPLAQNTSAGASTQNRTAIIPPDPLAQNTRGGASTQNRTALRSPYLVNPNNFIPLRGMSNPY